MGQKIEKTVEKVSVETEDSYAATPTVETSLVGNPALGKTKPKTIRKPPNKKVGFHKK
jgi:hypothetical protein